VLTNLVSGLPQLKLTVTCPEIAREVINVLAATKKHEIILLSRKVRDLLNPVHAKVSIVDSGQDPAATEASQVLPGSRQITVAGQS
jgi:hypothetical protein